ncbi:MAG TPA: pyridoxamine 5'-phosphate oxidase family protein, partial [Steroidobacteraceae bacterium]|nr:pyridoxamine 5'-phosphate oxidase family protein [Steroidobacteraceae bacterium]
MAWHREHLPDPLPAEPLEMAADWLAEATRRALQPNPNAMVLATADATGRPSARVVLCKQITPRPGYLTFYTNYRSRKGRELEARAQAAVVMHWDALHRQLR